MAFRHPATSDPTPTQPLQLPSPNLVAASGRLRDLRARGLLTDEEYRAASALLMG